jgi:hypothetical protein
VEPLDGTFFEIYDRPFQTFHQASVTMTTFIARLFPSSFISTRNRLDTGATILTSPFKLTEFNKTVPSASQLQI